MNAIKQFSLYFVLLNLISCANPEPFRPPRPNYWGTVSIRINEKTNYDYKPYAFLTPWNDSTLTIVIDGSNDYDEIRESLTIFNIPRASGFYSLKTGNLDPGELEIGASLSLYLYDGDVTGDIFKYDTSLGNSFINIQEWNLITGQIKGAFDVKVLRFNQPILNSEYPDTLHLQGEFFTKLDN